MDNIKETTYGYEICWATTENYSGKILYKLGKNSAAGNGSVNLVFKKLMDNFEKQVIELFFFNFFL